jgi:hypothetical protein
LSISSLLAALAVEALLVAVVEPVGLEREPDLA